MTTNQTKPIPFTLVPLASALPLLFVAPFTQAVCVTSTGTSIEYSCSGTQPAIISEAQSTTTNITANNWNLGAYSIYVQDIDPVNKTKIQFTGTDINSVNSNAAVIGNGIIHMAGYGDVGLSLTGSEIEANGAYHGIAAHALSGNAVTMNIIDSDINLINGTSGTVVAANAGQTAGASIDVLVNGGHLTANKGKGIDANMGGLGGNVTINTSNTLIETGSYGIAANNSGTTGNIVINNSSLITTNGTAAHGIYAKNTGGRIEIHQNTDVTVSGANSSAVYAQGTNNNIDITSVGTIKALGDYGMGIYGLTTNGNINITSDSDIAVSGALANPNNGSGIFATSTNGAVTINATHNINTNYGTTGSDTDAIRAYSGTGNISVTYDDADGTLSAISDYGDAIQITRSTTSTAEIHATIAAAKEISVNGSQAQGIFIGGGSGDVTVINHADVMNIGSSISDNNNGIYALNYNAGNINITSTSDMIVASNHSSPAIFASTQTGRVDIVASGQIQTTGGASVANAGNHGISSTSTTGDMHIQFMDLNSSITTAGQSSHGIHTSVAGGNTLIQNAAAISTHGAGSDTIYSIASKGNLTVENSGALTIEGDATATNAAVGIHTLTQSGNTAVTHRGDITNTGKSVGQSGAFGIFATSWGTGVDAGNSKVTASGNITIAEDTINLTSTTSYHEGIEAISRGAAAQVDYLEGNLKSSGNGFGSGITVWDNLSGEANTSATINVGAAGQSTNVLATGLNNIALIAASKTNNVLIGENTHIQGGYGVGAGGISLGHSEDLSNSINSTLSNNGIIDALNDVAVNANMDSGTAHITNNGSITGTINAAGTALALDNLSSNSWNIRNFADTDGDGVRDEKGIAISDFGGNVGGIIKNEVTGTIRLSNVTTENTINTAGQYLANGLASYDTSRAGVMQGQILGLARFENRGLIDLADGSNTTGNTLLISGGNQAGTNGGGTYVSDGGTLKMNVHINKGDTATQSDLLVVDNTILAGSATNIQINKVGGTAELSQGDGIKLVEVQGTSDAGSFSLASRALVGPYEYLLYQGSLSNPTNQSWYLRNITPDGKPIYRAEVGAYLGNQTAAVGMFMHTLHDRLGEPQFTEANKTDGNTPSVWIRAVTNTTDSKAGSGTLDQSTDTNLIHIGGELARWQNDANRLHFGLMGGYGQSKTDTTVNPTGRSSEGKVDGYSFGAYATWYGNKDLPTGPYVDGWLQYGSFKNKVNASGQNQEEYDSNLFTASIEAGYAFIMKDAANRQWMIEPQLQVAYNQYKADDHTDSTGMRIDGSDADGLITRLGARAYSRTKVGNGMQPFVEANWWHSDANNSLKFDAISISDDTPSDRFELKLGLQGEVAKDWQLWGHIGAQTGKDNYSRYEGMVGLKHLF